MDMLRIDAASIGNANFKADYGIKFAYLAGAMYKGIASTELVIKLGKAGFMGFFGSGGLRLQHIEEAIKTIQQDFPNHQPYGMNLLCNLIKPELEEQTVALFLNYGIKHIEAAAYMQMTPSLVWYRLHGLHRDCQGQIVAPGHILAKVSRPEVAQAFMSPAPPANRA